MVQATRPIGAPASLESVHRRIMGALHQVESQLPSLTAIATQSLTTTDGVTPKQCVTFLKALAERHEMPDSQPVSRAKLQAMLIREETDPPAAKQNTSPKKPGKRRTMASALPALPSTASEERGDTEAQEVESWPDRFAERPPTLWPEFTVFRSICDRAEQFSSSVLKLKQILSSTVDDQLNKFCLSFEQESKGEILRAVHEYQSSIIGWNDHITKAFEKADLHLQSISDYEDHMKRYICDYNSRVLDHMSAVCNCLEMTLEPIKRWVGSDANYSRRTQHDITLELRAKTVLQDRQRAMEEKRTDLAATVTRRAFACIRIEQELERIKESKRTLRRRSADIQDALMRSKAECGRKVADLEDVNRRLTSRTGNSPTVFNHLTELNETLKRDIRALESKLQARQQELLALQRDQFDTQKHIDALRPELKENHRAHDKAYAKLAHVDVEITRLHDDLTLKETQITLLKRIREIKLNSTTVKRLHHSGYQPGLMHNIDELGEAVRIAAECVGRDWPQLYHKLPFQPYRDYDHRARDIEVLDMATRRSPSPGSQTVAQRSLEKWRRLHADASLQDLLATLRRMRRLDTVRRIKKQLLKSPSAHPAIRRSPHKKHASLTI